jgi:hypothetical protein
MQLFDCSRGSAHDVGGLFHREVGDHPECKHFLVIRAEPFEEGSCAPAVHFRECQFLG